MDAHGIWQTRIVRESITNSVEEARAFANIGLPMASKYIYLGQNWETEELNSFGIGSVYLAGPRNHQAKSWRLDLINKIESTGLSLTYLIPEAKGQLDATGLCELTIEERRWWKQISIACTTAIIFWFPDNVCDSQSFVEFGCWCKSERVFLGGDPGEELNYLDWILHNEQKIHAVNTLDQLTERFVHWVMA